MLASSTYTADAANSRESLCDIEFTEEDFQEAIKELSNTSYIRRRNIEGKLINIEILLQKSYQASSQHNEQRAIDAIRTNPKYFFSNPRLVLSSMNTINTLPLRIKWAIS